MGWEAGLYPVVFLLMHEDHVGCSIHLPFLSLQLQP